MRLAHDTRAWHCTGKRQAADEPCPDNGERRAPSKLVSSFRFVKGPSGFLSLPITVDYMPKRSARDSSRKTLYIESIQPSAMSTFATWRWPASTCTTLINATNPLEQHQVPRHWRHLTVMFEPSFHESIRSGALLGSACSTELSFSQGSC